MLSYGERKWINKKDVESHVKLRREKWINKKDVESHVKLRREEMDQQKRCGKSC